MAKTKTPFLSLGAHGSVGESITAQKLRQETIIREKPLPTDPKSDLQLAQRSTFLAWGYVWRQLDEAARREYAATGSRHHLTGYQQFMKDHLFASLPMIGWWRLDEPQGAIAYDSTEYASNGIIVGAAPTTGSLGGAYFFDGINDRVKDMRTAILPLATDLFNVSFYIKTQFLQRGGIVSRYEGALFSWFFELKADGKPRFVIFNTVGGAYADVTGPVSVADNVRHHLAANWNPSILAELYVDELLVDTDNAFVGIISLMEPDLEFGKHQDGWYKGTLDNVIIFNQLQTQPEIALWAALRGS